MARMYPEDIDRLPEMTEAERTVFRFLRDAARPDEEYICWYRPQIGTPDKGPDFVLFGTKLGLLALEVRDWNIHDILSHTPTHFKIRTGETTKTVDNPDKKARECVRTLVELLEEEPAATSQPQFLADGARIPVGRMVAFPNIRNHEYADRGLRWIIPPERALLRDDVMVGGEILQDKTGSAFFDRVSSCMPFKLENLSSSATDSLRDRIWRDTQIEIPMRKGAGKVRFQGQVRAFDEAQARMARRLGPGHWIIKGPPGSGKTLVLVHRCCQVHKYDAKKEKILFVCFNIALASYIRKLIREKGVDPLRERTHVLHFYDLCSKVLQKPIHYENEGSDYYEGVVKESLGRVSRGRSPFGPFDVIFVDEGQDFGKEMMKILLGLLRLGGDLLIALDSYQDLYGTKVSWKSLGVNAAGRTRVLDKVYRNTVEISQFTQRFIGNEPEECHQFSLLPQDHAIRGDIPEMRQFADNEAIEDFLVTDIAESTDKEEYKGSEIAIIYDDKIYTPDGFTYDNRALPMRIRDKLQAHGIPFYWVSQDARAKEMYDITADRVSLISIHSSKGLDFDLVYLVGIDRIRPTYRTRKPLLNLVYVAMTRAKYRLVIPYVKETEFIRRIKECLSEQ
ncbi:MAG: ATP-binding domain-containing protein [Deltaproteobacteria bacterium]|nr:ATP-binding domain-containing protein [Deltaproteobacteria bacterium]